MTIKKILFNTRFRELAFSALEAVLELKKAGLEEIVLTYIIPREDFAFVPYGGYLKDEEARLQETAGLRFDQWRETIGKTAAEVIRLSRERGATMIAMGRTGKDWFKEYWLGGVSHRVAEHSELPVLLVP